MKKLDGYKTVVFFVLSLLVALANLFGFADFRLSSEQNELLLVAVSVGGLLLRYLTKGKIFKG